MMIFRFTIFTLFLFSCSLGISAQSVTGFVIDPANAAVTGASVKLIESGRKASRHTVTDSNGKFTFLRTLPGSYRLEVVAKGFRVKISEIDVHDDVAVDLRIEPRAIAEVVSVTSSYIAGTPEALERTPGAINVITKEELDLANVFNFAEALKGVSGVNVRNEEGFGLRPNISIRGSDPTRSRKVLLLEDGVPLSYAPYGDNSSYYHPPIERFESIEVLKGSGQIEYGPVTVAGVVNYVTPNPSFEPTFKLKLTGGNRDFFNGSAGFGGTFGNTGAVLNYTRKQGEGSRENIRAGVNDFSVKVIQTINANNVVTLKYSHFDESSRITYSGLTEAEYAENPRQNPFRNDDLEFFREGFSAVHTGIFSVNSSINTTFYSSYFSRDWWRQSSSSSERPNRLGVDPDCLSMADLNTTCGNSGSPRDFRVFGVEPRFHLSYKTGGIRSFLTTGTRIHYENQNRRSYNGDLPNSRAEGSQITENNFRNAIAVSAFVQNRFVWRNVSITPGLRVENVHYKRTNRLNGSSATTSLTQLIPGIGIAFNPFRNTTVFAGVHRGFAPPSTSDILTNNGGVVELDPELSWNYEAGLRTRPFEALSFEMTYFRNDYENQIIPASVAGGTGSTNTNAGRTLQEGVEFSGRIDSGRVFKTEYNLYFRTAYTLLSKAEFQDIRFSGISGFENILVTGNRLPYSPKNLITSSIGYEYQGLHGFIENVFVGSQFSDDLNTQSAIPNGQRGYIGSQTYLNATVNYKVEKLKSTFFFTVKNIGDRLFIVDRTRGIYPGSPRLFQSGLKIEF